MPQTNKDDDGLDIARKALHKIAVIATSLAVQKRRQLCGELGGHLFIAAESLRNAGPEQQAKLQKKALKLLRDVETMLVRRTASYAKTRSHRAFMEQAQMKTKYGLGDQDDDWYTQEIMNACRWVYQDDPATGTISRGLLEISRGTAILAKELILHVQKLNKPFDTKSSRREDSQPVLGHEPPECPEHIMSHAYTVLSQHMSCTCHGPDLGQQHLARLRLGPEKHADGHELYRFDLLFSSLPGKIGDLFRSWQDVGLWLPRYVYLRSVFG